MNIEQDAPKPWHLYFVRETSVMNLPAISNSQPIITCRSWSDFPTFLKLQPTSISFSASELLHTSAFEIVNMVSTMSNLVGIENKITVTVCIDKKTPYILIKLLQKSGVLGIVPNHEDFGIEETEKGYIAQWSGIPYWPKHIIEQLPGFENKRSKKDSEILLTTRQNQVLDIILTRGASNKHIAKMLKISESTVKLHVGAILKKHGLTNRTQLAVFSKKNLTPTEVQAC